MNANESIAALSKVCDEVNTAGPELDPIATGAFAFSLLMDALREDYGEFLGKLVGTEPTSSQALFRESVLEEVERFVGLVKSSLRDRSMELGKQTGPAPIHEVTRIKIEDLPQTGLAEIEDKLVPIVVEGGVRDTEAVKRWTPQLFKERYGDVVVPTDVYAGVSRPLGEFIQELIESKGKSRGFITTNEDVFNAHPELVEQLDVSRIARRLNLTEGQPNFGNHLFLSGRMGFCPWHSAGDTNLFYMVYGRKDWVLAHPKHTNWLHASMCAGHMRGHFTVSRVNPRKSISREADEPLANLIPLYRALLEPGDLLIVPPWWMHTVANLDEIAIGVAARLTTPALRNKSAGAGVLATVERVFPKGTHMMDLANWKRLSDEDPAVSTNRTDTPASETSGG